MSTSINEDVNRRRDRHDIILEILKTAIDGQVKTHIMYKAKLSYAQLNEYLPTLVENGLLENQKVERRKTSKQVLKTTQKGLRFIESFETINKLWSPLPNSSEKQSFYNNS
jgi:predicted transcriptional regulator